MIPWREAGGRGIVHWNAENTIAKKIKGVLGGMSVATMVDDDCGESALQMTRGDGTFPPWSSTVGEPRKPQTPEEFRARIQRMWDEEGNGLKVQYWIMGPKEYAWWS